MNKEKEREYLINCLKQALELNISNCVFMKKLYQNNKEATKTLNKSIKQSEKALDFLPHIKHIEILRAIYGDIVGKISGMLMVGGTLITSKELFKADTNEKCFKDFVERQKEIQEEYKNKLKERAEQQKAIEKAKEQGKKVEYMVDPTTKKLKPIIMEKGDNNA